MRTAKVIAILGESATYLWLTPRTFYELPGTSLSSRDSTPNKSKADLSLLFGGANADITSPFERDTDEHANAADGPRRDQHLFTAPGRRSASARGRSEGKSSWRHLDPRDSSAATLRAGRRAASGKSLGDSANGRGQGRDGLVAALTLAANTRIDKAVSENRLTADQATALKAKVTAEIASFVDRKYPAKSTTTKRTTTKTP